MNGGTFPSDRPEVQMTLNFFQKLGENRDRMPDHVALQHLSRDHKESFSYSRIAEEVSKIAGFLRDQGIGPGKSVGLLMENHPRWGSAFGAIQSTGIKAEPTTTPERLFTPPITSIARVRNVT